MFDVQKDRLQRIAIMYGNVKALVVHCEEISGETYPQLLLELRDVLDHIARAISVETGISNEDTQYVSTNLDSAYNHLYRAGYDALDWSGLLLRDLIDKALSETTTATILKVYPDYYKTIKPRIFEISDTIGKLRAIKDIGTPKLEIFNSYLKLTEELEGYYSQLIALKPSFAEVDEQTKRDNKMDKVWKFIIPLGVGIIALILGKLWR